MRCLAVSVLVIVLAVAATAQKPKPRPSVTKPKPSATPQKKLNEQAEWEKATALSTPAERIEALNKFLKSFPKSTRLAEATTLLVTAEYGYGNDKLVAGEIDEAADLYTAAATHAPSPVPAEMWNEQLSRIAPNLYFRGARGEALDITKLFEEKASASVPQMLSIASFYLSIENGTEAKRVAEAAIKLDANSSAAYQTLGLANRMDFQLEESAAAFAKALELEPESLTARRGLAEMKRSLGKADEAAALYREILAKDEANVPARTGLVLSLFDAGDRSDAEAEMAKSLEANPGNVILLAGAAYWYAAQNEGDKAVDFAQKAIAADPRFIWSHIAMARGLLAQNKPVEAEKTLLAARRYGNFPTLEYELASARLAAGLFREAAEELARSFTVKDGLIQARLGGRVERGSKYFTELVGFERRASIFAPTAADNPDSAAQLRALLELKQALETATPDADAAARAADDLIRGDDKMKVHRQLFAATQLLDTKIALPKVLEIIKAAPQNLDAGLDVPDVSTAVLASELYESRRIAAAREDYVAVPTVPRATLSSVLRGRIEEITGWAHYQMDDAAQAAVHLRRAVGVLPADSSYWRSSLWRLGTALMVGGNDAEALDAYIKGYKGTQPDAVRYNAIAAVYKRVNGSTDGLEAQIGPDPSAALVSQVTAEPSPAPLAAEVPTPTPAPAPRSDQVPAVVPIASPTPTSAADLPSPSPTPVTEEMTPSLTEEAFTTPTSDAASPSPTSDASPTPTVVATPPAVIDAPPIVSIASPEPVEVEPAIAQEQPKPSPTPTAETPTPSPTSTPTPDVTPSPEPTETTVAPKPDTTKELFPPVVITIPVPDRTKPTPAKGEPTPTPAPSVLPDPSPEPTPSEAIPDAKAAETPHASPTPEEPIATPTPTPEPTPAASPPPTDGRSRVVEGPPEIPACRLTVSEETVTLHTGGGDVAVIVGRTDDNELDGLTAVSTSPDDVAIRRQVIEGMKTRALFILHPGNKPGVYQVTFEMPCGKREIVVRVK